MEPPAALDFSLHPFDAGSVPQALRLGGQVARDGGRLSLLYRLQGPLETVHVPPPARTPGRLDGLWSSTCFECFLAIEGESPYWEFNLSPAGHWNAYALAGYRAGLRPEPAYRSLAPQLDRGERSLTLQVAFPLPPSIPLGTPLLLGITAVIEALGGGLSYWALAHGGAEPDFHRRDGFLLRL
jgi:hypothetical protein